MIRVLLIIALLYIVFFYLPRQISRGMSRSQDNAPQPRQTKTKEETTVSRVEEPKPRVLDTSDASEAHFEEVEEEG